MFIFLRNEKKIARVHSKIQNNDAEEIILIFLSKKKNSPVEATLIGIWIIYMGEKKPGRPVKCFTGRGETYRCLDDLTGRKKVGSTGKNKNQFFMLKHFFTSFPVIKFMK